MYYRRKVILALLQQFGGRLKPIPFQQLLLIFTRKQQEKPAYEFVPYKYGAHSFQAISDKGTMIKYGQLQDKKHWIVNTDKDYIQQLDPSDQKLLADLDSRFKDYGTEELIKYAYREYPYYAIRSETAEQYVPEEVGEKIERFRPQNDDQKLYTIGYEGIKAEKYMNKLLQKDVKLLADVRKNSMSMKFGFNKSQLRNMCEKLDILFAHLPELGIASEKRKNLDTKADYEELFEEYEQEILPRRKEQLGQLYKWFQKHNRVAITCFEKEHTSCHRHKISAFLHQEYGVPVEHL